MFDTAFLKKLEHLSLASRRVFQGQLLANRRGRQLGSGIEFADHRNYSFGDDLRYLDWNVYARFGNQLIRRFEEEKDLNIYFLLDCSKSMSAGNPNKFDYARQVVAALAYVALAGLDRVSLIAFADKLYQTFPAMRGKQHILRSIRFLESLETLGSTTDLAAAMREFVLQKQHTGLVVVVSDFYDPKGFKAGLDILRYQKYEPHIIQIHDGQEAEPAMLGDLQLHDVETGGTFDVTISEDMLRRYKRKFASFLDDIRRYGIDNALNCIVSSTAVPFDELIMRMLLGRNAEQYTI
ncbi:MAG: DUF58 domain-containing protein [Planctomycetaceae bacterium]|nr:DUF58 domain-containing protein [Planctomycetaceae bacterium]